MARIPLAMKQLIAEVTETFEDVRVELDEVDGLGAYRKLILEIAPDDKVEALSFLLERDDRLHEVVAFDGDQDYNLTAVFVADPRSDEKRSFGVASMVDVAVEIQDPVGVTGGPGEQTLYSEEELKGKRIPSLLKLVTGADATTGGADGAWSRDELIDYLTTGDEPDYETPDPDVVDDEPDAE